MARPDWLPAVARAACDQLEAAGVRVAFDLRNVSPPLVLVLPQEMRGETACVAEVDVQFSAVAPGPNHADAVRWLWEEVAPILAAHCPVIESVVFEQYPGLQGTVTGAVAIANPQQLQKEVLV